MRYLLALLICFFSMNADDTYGHRPFFVMSPPKCGTHLIGKALELILNKSPSYNLSDLGTTDQAVNYVIESLDSGSFAIAHHFNKETVDLLTSQECALIFMMRDPRDQLISVQNWLREGQWKWIPTSKIRDRKSQLYDLITGSKKGWKCVDSCFLPYYNAVNRIKGNRIYFARFENLVGTSGGGNDSVVIEELMKLASFLEVSLTHEQAEDIAAQLFGGTNTFRSGKIGAWKSQFSKIDKKAFKKRYNSLLINLGYEKNDKW